MELLDFTTADRTQLDRVWRAIAEEMGDDRFFTTKELDYLPRILSSEEQVLAFSSGLHKGNTWLIVLTNERVIFLDKGMIYGLRQSSIEIERINNFESKKGLMFGTISIGSNAEIYEISNVWKKTVDPFTKKLREAMKAKQNREMMRSPGTDNIEPRDDEEVDTHVDEDHDLVVGDYDVYTPPEESGPLALHALNASPPHAPDERDTGAVRHSNPALERLARAGLI